MFSTAWQALTFLGHIEKKRRKLSIIMQSSDKNEFNDLTQLSLKYTIVFLVAKDFLCII